MNKIIIENKLKIKIVSWKNISHARKSEKMGFIKGTLEDFSMFIQIVRTIGVYGIIKQIVKMSFLRV